MTDLGLSAEEATRVFTVYIAWVNYEIQIIPNMDELSSMDREVFDGALYGRYAETGANRFLNDQLRSVYPERAQYIDNAIARISSRTKGLTSLHVRICLGKATPGRALHKSANVQRETFSA